MSGRRVAVLGATGGTGSAIVRRAIALGDSVTVLVRDASRLHVTDGSVRIVVGDGVDPTAVAQTVRDADVVLSAIGRRPAVLPARDVTVCENTTANVIRAISDPGSVRYVVVSSVGMYLPTERNLWPWERFVAGALRLAYRSDFNDRDREASILVSSPIRWTLIRPSILIAGPAGRYGVHCDRVVGPVTTREAVADFALRASADPRFEHTAPYISSWIPPRFWLPDSQDLQVFSANDSDH
jgi:putative NADH-flavin reductase